MQTIPLAIVAAGALIAGAIVIAPRSTPHYAIVQGSEPGTLYRIDTRSGAMLKCREQPKITGTYEAMTMCGGIIYLSGRTAALDPIPTR